MFSISFDFDETTKKVTNLLVVSKTPTVKQTYVGSVLEIGDNKLLLSKELIKELQIKPGERVNVNYYTIDNQNTIPIIGKSEYFIDKESGNKLTKSNTVSFKGVQKTVLSKYGSIFTTEKFDKIEGTYKLIPYVVPEEIVEDLTIEENELDLLSNGDFDQEINNTIKEDDFPF